MVKFASAGGASLRNLRPTFVSRGKRAFSLVEVILSLGIAAFALVVLIALLPVGLQANRDSRQQSVAVSLVNALISDLTYSPKTTTTVIYQLPAVLDPSHTSAQGLQSAATITNAFSDGLQLLPTTTDANARYEAVVTRQSWYTNSLSPVLYSIGVNTLPQPAAAKPPILQTVVAIPAG